MSHDIQSPSNDRIKQLVGLKRRKHRDAERRFVVEEKRIFDRALDAGHRPVEVYWAPELTDRPWEGKVTTVSEVAMAKAAYGERSGGMIAVFDYLDLNLGRLTVPESPLCLIAESMEKPGNIGAMLRVADGVGVDVLIIADPLADPFNPNVVRASTGAIFTVPMAMASTPDVAGWLGSNAITAFAAMDGAELTIWESDLRGPLAIWIGSEADGLSDEAIAAAYSRVRIPMAGPIDSLNASVSAAVIAYEARRQRVSPSEPGID